LWYWEYESDEEKHKLFMDVGEKIRFKVKEEIFVDTSPPGPTSSNVGATGDPNSLQENQRKTPYMIKVLVKLFIDLNFLLNIFLFCFRAL